MQNVTPGASIAVRCTGWPADDAIAAAEFSPLIVLTGSDTDIDPNFQYFTSNAEGVVDTTVTVPKPFSAPDPDATCPPTPVQISLGLLACGIVIADQNGIGTGAALLYSGQTLPGPAPGAARSASPRRRTEGGTGLPGPTAP